MTSGLCRSAWQRAAQPRRGRACCTRSPTPAGTAGTSCCPAAGRRSASRSSARTTPGPTISDGELQDRQGLQGHDGFDDTRWGLVELPVTDWHGLIFVDGSGTAGPLEPALAELDELVAPYEPERLVIAGRHSYDAAANWKILTENYHECYHCPMIHPELCKVSPPKSGENYQAERAVGRRLDGPARRHGHHVAGRHSLGVPLRGLDATGLRTVIYVNVFPNVLLSLHPDYVMTHRLTPLAADRTLIECTWAFAPEALEQPGFDPGYAVEFWDITNQQDWGACESVQRGLSSAHAVPGPLSPDEDAVYQFVTQVARGYTGQPVWTAVDAPPRSASTPTSHVPFPFRNVARRG